MFSLNHGVDFLRLQVTLHHSAIKTTSIHIVTTRTPETLANKSTTLISHDIPQRPDAHFPPNRLRFASLQTIKNPPLTEYAPLADAAGDYVAGMVLRSCQLGRRAFAG